MALAPGATAPGTSLLVPGDYAVYSIGIRDECVPGTYLYSPLFGLSSRAWVEACPVTVRWEVLDLADGIASVRLGMEGWRQENIKVSDLPRGDPVTAEILAHLNADHLLRVDVSTLETYNETGVSIGRWGFHLTTAEIASGEALLARNWYNQSEIPAQVAVTQDLISYNEIGVSRAYGVDTFAWAETGGELPFPAGLEEWVYNIGGGWQTLKASGPIYDAASSLLLYCLGVHYSDLLFNLYGIIWIDVGERVWPDTYPSTISLIETNVINMPGQIGEDDMGGPGDGSDPGGEDDSPVQEDGSGAQIPWPTIALFAAVTAAVGFVAYRTLLLRKRSGKV